MAVALMTEPCGAILPLGKTTVLVRPRAFACCGDIMTSFGSMPSFARRRSRAKRRRSLLSHQSNTASSLSPVTVSTSVLSSPRFRRWHMTSGTPPAI